MTKKTRLTGAITRLKNKRTDEHNHTTKNFFRVLLNAKSKVRLAMFSGIAFQRGTQVTKKDNIIYVTVTVLAMLVS